MIERLGIAGFKPFGPHGIDLPLAPITVILGENSVGKSSIFHVLLALQQSWEQSYASIGMFSPYGNSVDLGRFGNCLHRGGDQAVDGVSVTIKHGTGDATRHPEVGFLWVDPKQAMTQEDGSPPRDLRQDQQVGWSTAAPSSDRGRLDIITVRPAADTPPFHFAPSWDPERRLLSLTLLKDSVDEWLERLPAHQDLVRQAVAEGAGFVWHIDAVQDASLVPSVEDVTLGPSEQGDALQQLQAVVADSPTQPNSLWNTATISLSHLTHLRRTVRSITHIGGIRERGKRLYEPNLADDPWRVGRSGERIADVLLNHPQAVERTNDLLDAAGVGYRVRLREAGLHSQAHELLLEDTRPGRSAGNHVGLPDVGTGIAQMLPVAVQVAALSDSTRFDIMPLLLVEQPELHLHPRLQAHLAHLFVEAITLERAQASARPVQIVIETHSEHLVLGLGAMIYQKKLLPSAVSLLFLDRDPKRDEITATRITFDGEGYFKDTWPKGFFQERQTLERGELP